MAHTFPYDAFSCVLLDSGTLAVMLFSMELYLGRLIDPGTTGS